ncbi:phage head closure protein [Manganibacter manganicus]|uniref:Phage head-tail adapter protein n=1 Tax=Manganibacter manganicus TaxID=1873176 RepID=A0A1V8RQ06_9HYPH|nr:phage head closure protein [Pseudaminobacter manganicus]OQM75213.1 phage head-tail adapter protein [Pseudaminobacter manganicus]
MPTLFLDPGRLRTELALEVATPVADELGGFTQSWAETGIVFAHVEPVSARSRPGADQMLETMTHRITLRHRAGVASGMRFRKGPRIFAIATVHDPDESGRYLVCTTREEGR